MEAVDAVDDPFPSFLSAFGSGMKSALLHVDAVDAEAVHVDAVDDEAEHS